VGLLIDTRFCHVVALSCACEAKNQKKEKLDNRQVEISLGRSIKLQFKTHGLFNYSKSTSGQIRSCDLTLPVTNFVCFLGNCNPYQYIAT